MIFLEYLSGIHSACHKQGVLHNYILISATLDTCMRTGIKMPIPKPQTVENIFGLGNIYLLA